MVIGATNPITICHFFNCIFLYYTLDYTITGWFTTSYYGMYYHLKSITMCTNGWDGCKQHLRPVGATASDGDQLNQNGHQEVVIRADLRLTQRPIYTIQSYPATGRDRGNVEILLQAIINENWDIHGNHYSVGIRLFWEAVIEPVRRWTWGPLLRKNQDALGGIDWVSVEMHWRPWLSDFGDGHWRQWSGKIGGVIECCWS